VDVFDAGIQEARKRGKTPKLMVFSAPPYKTGAMLPIRELADLAIRERMYTVVDAAHVSGMFDVNFHDLGVDFMACSGHKWQCGPGGTGIWYIRNQTESNPLELPRFFPTNTHTYGNDFAEFFRDGYFCSAAYAADGGNRYTAQREPLRMGRIAGSHGIISYPNYATLADVCDFWGAIGYDRIESYVLGLSRKAKDKVKELWGEEALYCPCTPGLESAMTTFVPGKAYDPTDRKAARAFALEVRERGLVVRNTNTAMPNGEHHNPVRISTHLFNDDDDVASAFETMAEVARKA
jgi:selenocysteine lyase/cysteine desulfurase